MYTPQQEKAHIYELQQMLYYISLENISIPEIIPDGIYGKETANAVKAFQQYYGLKPTGETNPATWEKIAEVYLELENAVPLPLTVFSPHEVLRQGDHAFCVRIAQTILDALAQEYDNMPECAVTGNFDSDTLYAVQVFQKMCALPMTGEIDCNTWNALARAGDDMK